jgi:SAM-dependent methyltransferase
MFWPDIPTLEAFYRSPTGNIAFTHIQEVITEFWPHVTHETVMGLGFSSDYLEAFCDNTNRVIAIMPAAQGCMRWPQEGASHSCLADEAELPLADNSIDRILLAHVLEYSDQSKAMLREIWRVLSPDGRLLIVMPNRLGLWSHMERTPFGHGHPFNAMQITRLLHDAMFTSLRSTSTLFMLPTASPFLTNSPLWEKLGKRWLQPFGGVLITEASKQLYSIIPTKPSMGDKFRTYVLNPQQG